MLKSDDEEEEEKEEEKEEAVDGLIESIRIHQEELRKNKTDV